MGFSSPSGSVSSAGSQGNTDVFPVSYHANKACYDRMMLALSTKFPDVPMLTLWPGSVATERMVVGKRRFQGWLQDAETPSFTGRAVLLLSKLSFEAKLRLSGRTVTSAEVLYMAGGYDVDGYRHDLPRETMFATAQSFLQAPAKTRVTV
ncbi:Dehydrogenase/reductase SDR family member 1 [Durusdinium trenchii]|uniref:Dehydrogenase/reductase SDR family member 1 n=1 Tax=Durusdinium trenchii TaxID=1381693 RepID=A0ABP0JIE3_9DINO